MNTIPRERPTPCHEGLELACGDPATCRELGCYLIRKNMFSLNAESAQDQSSGESKISGALAHNMTSATPKPRAGEHVRWADQYDFDRSDPATRLFIAASNWVDRCEAAEAERDLLRERLDKIKAELSGIEPAELTKAERNILNHVASS